MAGLALHHDGTFPVFHHDLIRIGDSVDSKVLNGDLNWVRFHQVFVLNPSSVHSAFICRDEFFAVLIPPSEIVALMQQTAQADICNIVQPLSFDWKVADGNVGVSGPAEQVRQFLDDFIWLN